MTIRAIEICPNCGQFDPWRVYKSDLGANPPRKYAKCRRCGKTETIVYRQKVSKTT